MNEPVISALDEGSPELWDTIFKMYEDRSAESCQKFTTICQGKCNPINSL